MDVGFYKNYVLFGWVIIGARAYLKLAY